MTEKGTIHEITRNYLKHHFFRVGSCDFVDRFYFFLVD
jgi:hypothetical protein